MLFKMYRIHNTKVSYWRILLHDLDKLILTIFISSELASKIHRKIAKHHNIKTDEDFYEAYLDWSSARYTKPDKPMDALVTAEKIHPKYYGKALLHYKIVKFK